MPVRLLLAALPLYAFAVPLLAQQVRPSPEQEYWAQFERRDWEKAVAEAEKLVEAARMNSNAAPLELAADLSLLGNAHLANKNYLAAESSYSEALQIIEPRVPPTSDKLLDPLRGLGYTLAAANKPSAAVPVLERALLVSRRTHGLLNFNQQGILRQLAASQTRLGNFQAAEQQMQYLLRVGEHTYGARDPRMAAVYEIVGDFRVQAGFVVHGREAYREALRVVEKKLGRDHLATVEPLRAYAQSFRQELFLALLRTSTERSESLPTDRPLNPRFLSVEGERALLRALKTLDANSARSTIVLFDTLLDLGDWYMVKGEPDTALPYYRRATGLVEQVEPERQVSAQAQLSFPTQLFFAVPPLATRNLWRSDQEVEEKFVHLQFTVAADGAVRNETVVDQDASPRQVTEALAAIRSARYRPKFVNGEPVDTKDVSLRQVFRQRRETE